MTPSQIDLLKRLIDADRDWRTRTKAGELVDQDFRGLEIGWINGINPRTAQVLAEAGLAEIIHVGGTRNLIFLGKANPYDDQDEI